MKQILFTALAAVAVLLSSCSKDDNNSTKSSKPIKISIGGAKYIYENSNATRTSSGELAKFMAVNAKGESTPIRFLNSDNDTINMDIYAIQNLGDEYVILSGLFRYTDNTGTVSFHNMLANKKTELVYAMNTKFNLTTSAPLTYIDQNNNLYQQTGGLSDDMIYKYNVSDPNNIRLSEYIPKFEEHTGFIVNKRGFCFYATDYGHGFKIKCPGGRIYTHSELFPEGMYDFSIFKGYKNDTFFIVVHYADPGYLINGKSVCYELVENGLNELVFTQRSEIDYTPYYKYREPDVLSNHIQKTYLMQGYDGVLEYNEETQKLTELNMEFLGFGQNRVITKNYVFSYSSDGLWILKLSDNTHIKINLVGKYELRSIDGNIDSDEVSFSGLRFADGRNIVGTIDKNGQFHAIETINATEETVLIRLN